MMLMPWRVTGGIALLLATGAATVLAITITFRNGATQTGEIVRMDDTNLTLKTSLGEKTYLWRALESDDTSTATTTFDADYWDIKVWINETLVYSEENGNEPGYFHVQKL
ncbi:MAG: hypothetical protein NTV22_14800 [bacterium]|nr:hypothetical protein [bacterium]